MSFMELSLHQAADLLHKADTIVLTAHVNPDGDSLGAMLGLYEALQSQGKRVQMLLDDAVPPGYQFLPNWRKIIRPGDNEHLRSDLLVVLDASDFDRIGRVGQAVTAPILNIDHHISNTRFADYLCLDCRAAATGEIVLQLLRLMNQAITADMASCLYTAIATDCGFFRYANTTPATLHCAADLVSAGAQPHVISEALDRRPLASLRTLTEVLQTIEMHHNGTIATIAIHPGMLTDSNESSEGFIDYPRSIEGVEVAILFRAMDDHTVRVSMRSHRVDVSKVALAFGGGGHVRAAGCTVHGGLEQAKERVVEAIRQKIG